MAALSACGEGEGTAAGDAPAGATSTAPATTTGDAAATGATVTLRGTRTSRSSEPSVPPKTSEAEAIVTTEETPGGVLWKWTDKAHKNSGGLYRTELLQFSVDSVALSDHTISEASYKIDPPLSLTSPSVRQVTSSNGEATGEIGVLAPTTSQGHRNNDCTVTRTRTKLTARDAADTASVNITLDRDLCMSFATGKPVWEKTVVSFHDNKGSGLTTTQEIEAV